MTDSKAKKFHCVKCELVFEDPLVVNPGFKDTESSHCPRCSSWQIHEFIEGKCNYAIKLQYPGRAAASSIPKDS